MYVKPKNPLRCALSGEHTYDIVIAKSVHQPYDTYHNTVSGQPPQMVASSPPQEESLRLCSNCLYVKYRNDKRVDITTFDGPWEGPISKIDTDYIFIHPRTFIKFDHIKISKDIIKDIMGY